MDRFGLKIVLNCIKYDTRNIIRPRQVLRRKRIFATTYLFIKVNINIDYDRPFLKIITFSIMIDLSLKSSLSISPNKLKHNLVSKLL